MDQTRTVLVIPLQYLRHVEHVVIEKCEQESQGVIAFAGSIRSGGRAASLRHVQPD